MHSRVLLASAFALLVTMLLPLSVSSQDAQLSQLDEQVQALDGVWLYVEDRTAGRALEDQQPPMSARFQLRIEQDAIIHVRPRGDERIAIDGSVTEVAGDKKVTRYRGEWKQDTFWYETEVWRENSASPGLVIHRDFRVTPEGLLVGVRVGGPTQLRSVALYRHPDEVPLPAPAKATVEYIAWLADGWVGQMGTSSIEERWSPPAGGALLGLSRTVKNGKMVMFEFLRIVERDGGLVYVAQPGGKPPTEFVLTEIAVNCAVFVNPRHDFPQRIVYEQTEDGGLTTSIGFAKGGRPRRFGFKKEGQ